MTLYKPSFEILLLKMYWKTICYSFLGRPNMNGNASLTQSPRLLDQVRGKIRLKHYSLRTEQAYVDWIKRFVLHFDKRHPDEMGAHEVEVF